MKSKENEIGKIDIFVFAYLSVRPKSGHRAESGKRQFRCGGNAFAHTGPPSQDRGL